MKTSANFQSIVFKNCELSEKVNYVIYTLLFISSVFVNKYVLSVLQFTYPTVFQGWQTLVVVIVLKCVAITHNMETNPLSFVTVGNLLPHCFFYIGAIVAGSKALASLPIPIFVCMCNVSPTCIFLADQWTEPVTLRWVSIIAACMSLLTSVTVLFVDMTLPFADSGYSWLLAHIVFMTGLTLHIRITNPRYTDLDRVFYGNLIGVVVLTPASLYLEEAFQALQFQHRRQMKFYIGCLLSGVLTAVLQLWIAKGKPCNQAVARLAAGVMAFPVFPFFGLSPLVQGLVVLNLFFNIFIPESSQVQDKNSELTDMKSVQHL